jgi:hypothetical protein
LARFRLRFTPRDNRFAAAKEAVPVEHDNTAAAVAADFDIRAGADDSPFGGTAGMRLAGCDDITEKNLFRHCVTSGNNSGFRANGLPAYHKAEGRKKQRGLQKRKDLVE